MPGFNRIELAKVPRSAFDLSYSKKFTCEIGLLYPVMCEETVPGDIWSVGYESVFRASPLAAPMLHRLDVRYGLYYIPNRIVMDEQDWMNFITGGEDGDDTTTLPTWNPSAAAKRNYSTLWDMLFGLGGITPDADSLPLDFPRRAYFDTFNEWFRDVAVEPAIDYTQAVGSNLDMDGNALPTGYNDDEDMQYAAWAKDYFTASRPSQQLGDPVSLSIGSATWPAFSAAPGTSNMVKNSVSDIPGSQGTEDTLNANTIASVDVSDMRLAFQIQKWQELNMRAGVRYPEWTKAHYGISVRDDRINRPEYIGGAKQPVVVSEVASTYDDGVNDPVGTLAGKATSMNGNFLGKFRAPEFGWVMVLMYVQPKAAYHQGLHRQFTRRTRWDFYSPEFANLSEQAILRRELYTTGVKADNETVFGYAPIWDELRTRMDTVHGEMRPGITFDYWHMGRLFSAPPTLSASFIRMYDVNDDPWVTTGGFHFFVNHANLVKVVRPMPFISSPGNVDR